MSLFFRGCLLFLLLSMPLTFVFSACSGDDDTAAPTPPTRSVGATGSQNYSWVDLKLSNFQTGATLVLRASYWDTGELTSDPQARVAAQAGTVFRVEFMSLAAGNFVGTSARILLAVHDSVGDELQGIVVLCDENGPIILAPECQGDCAPLCGLPGHDCNG